jgi:phenylalanyl-tRNA synthetase alpha chain
MIDVDVIKQELLAMVESSERPSEVLRSAKMKELYSGIKSVSAERRAEYGRQVNDVKTAVQAAISAKLAAAETETLTPIDVSAPFDVNTTRAPLLSNSEGSIHPLNQEIARISDIFYRMGYATEESREIDDQYHMFESLNFPKGHPARDDYDTFMTVDTDNDGDQLIAPAHTSTMQNRILKKYKHLLDDNGAIAAIVPDRVFRNEDLDARHEHTFYQVEGVYVAKGVHAGMLVATLKRFLEEYYEQALEVRVNPFYFPFTEPSFEFALSCPFCTDGCSVCSGSKWIELLGCGMIHPNVLRAADIDPTVYSGFAFGCGIDRLIMMKHQIEDIRHLESGKLDFLKQF